jgi:hypothetical protein
MKMALPSARENLDEKAFITMARQHKVVGTVYNGMEIAGIRLSAENMQILAREAMVGRATRSLLLRDWQELVAAFIAAGIRALTIKGPASSIQLYGDPLTREFSDLDILVDIPEIQQILPMMTILGYETVDKLPTMEPGFFQQKRCHHVSFIKPGRPFRIEIHGKDWQDDKDFTPEYMDGLFSRSEALGKPGEWGDSLSPADHALFMLVHGTQHAWCLLHWLLDFATLLDQNNGSMIQAFSGQVRLLGLERQLKLACAVVRSVYPVAIPELIRSIIDGDAASIAIPLRFALDRLDSGGKDGASLKNVILHSCVFMPSLTKGPFRKARLIIRPFLTPQVDAEALPLPKLLRFLYLPLRPFFVLTRRFKKRFGGQDAL